MRIFHLIHTPRYSGAEILVRDLSLLHAHQGHSVAIGAFFPSETGFNDEIQKTESSGVEWYLPSKPLSNFERILMIRRWVSDFQPDVIVAHSVIPSAYVRFAFLRHRIATVSVLHSIDDFSDWKYKITEKLLKKRSNAIVAVSTFSAENYVMRLQGHSNIKVIPNGIDLENILSSVRRREQERLRFGLEQTLEIILQVGRINPIKRQHLSLQSLAKLHEKNEKIELWFAGPIEDQIYYNQLQEMIKELGLRDKVKFLGARSDIADLYSIADLCLMPSEHEAHSLAFIEALASETPMVASTIESFKFAKKYEGVELIDPEDAESFASKMESLLSVRNRYERDLSEFSMGKVSENYLKLFFEVLRKEGRHA